MRDEKPIITKVTKLAFDACETATDLLVLTGDSPCIVLSLFMTAYKSVMDSDLPEDVKLGTVETLREQMRVTLGIAFQVVNSANPEITIDLLKDNGLRKREVPMAERRSLRLGR